MVTSTAHKVRTYNAQQLIDALTEASQIYDVRLDEMLLTNVDMTTVYQQQLTDGSMVYDAAITYVGPDRSR